MQIGTGAAPNFALVTRALLHQAFQVAALQAGLLEPHGATFGDVENASVSQINMAIATAFPGAPSSAMSALSKPLTRLAVSFAWVNWAYANAPNAVTPPKAPGGSGNYGPEELFEFFLAQVSQAGGDPSLTPSEIVDQALTSELSGVGYNEQVLFPGVADSESLQIAFVGFLVPLDRLPPSAFVPPTALGGGAAVTPPGGIVTPPGGAVTPPAAASSNWWMYAAGGAAVLGIGAYAISQRSAA